MNQSEFNKAIAIAAKLDVDLRAAQADLALDTTCGRASFSRIVGDMSQAREGVKAAIAAIRTYDSQSFNAAVTSINVGANDIPSATNALSSISTQTC